MYLEGNRIFDFDSGLFKGYKATLPFEISIHDPMTVADLQGNAVEVEAGYITTFLITPFQIVTSANARGLTVNDRKCMFKHDKEDLTLFKGYSQANCLFECQLKIAYDKCQCVPWDYPHLNDSWSICDRFGRECFLDMMIKVDLHKECNCILDCAITRYTYSLHTNKINAEELCSKKKYLSFMSSGTTGYPPKFIRRYEQIVYGKDIGNDVLCQNRTRNMAIVRFQIADQIITRIKKTQRMTFADFVSNIGTSLHT